MPSRDAAARRANGPRPSRRPRGHGRRSGRARPRRLDLGDIAERAGVGRTTVYRRWGQPRRWWPICSSDMAEASSPAARAAPCSATSRPTLPGAADARRPSAGPLFAALIAAATTDVPRGRARALLRPAHRGVGALRPRCGRTRRAGRGHRRSRRDPRRLRAAVLRPPDPHRPNRARTGPASRQSRRRSSQSRGLRRRRIVRLAPSSGHLARRRAHCSAPGCRCHAGRLDRQGHE